MKLSKELRILVLAYRLALFDEEKEEFVLLFPSVDKQELVRLANYHQVQLILYYALEKIEYKGELRSRLYRQLLALSIRNEILRRELSLILQLFHKNEIEVTPYKGLLFQDMLYGGQNMRISGDVDILIRNKSETSRAIKLLIGIGYKISGNADFNLDDLQEWIMNYGKHELGLDRKQNGVNIHIDFHFSANEKYHEYNINNDDFFVGSDFAYVSDKIPFSLSPEIIFKMILNHHGSRDCWLKLKDIIEFDLFFRRFPEYYDSIKLISEGLKMKSIFNIGDNLREGIIYEEKVNFSHIEQSVIRFWERGIPYGKTNLFQTIQYWDIYNNLQDRKKSYWELGKIIVKYYAESSPFDDRYFMPFNKKYYYLNFMMKMFGMAYYRITGSYYERLDKMRKLTDN